MRPSSCVVAVVISFAALGCGASSPAGTHTSADTRATPLGRRMAIPGTGVSIEPPQGASLLPLGPGLDVSALDLTIMVAVAEGTEAVRSAFRESLFVDGSDARRSEVLLGNGGAATIGRDVLRGPAGALPRVWLVAERGRRTLALSAIYRRGSDRGIERLVVSSLSSVRWDPSVHLEPSEAIGVSVGPVTGLSPDRSTVGTLAFTESGAPFPPPEGGPILFVLPLAEETPTERTLSACAEVLDRARVIASGEDRAAMVEIEGAWGCERLGVHRTRTGELLFAYAAVIFLAPGPVLLTGMVRRDRRDEWAPRFSAAARTVRYLRES